MSPSSVLVFMLTLSLFSLLSLSSRPRPLCHDDERVALMQLKQSFIIIDQRACAAAAAATAAAVAEAAGGVGEGPIVNHYPKLNHWSIDDCCSWDGVECEGNTGRVVGLDLSGSCLYGSINSSNPLFQLHQLERLNLAFNHFNYSLIPSALGNLSMLTYLNLSHSWFSGEIPWEVSKLFRLTSLDLSFNFEYPSFEGLLQLKPDSDNDMKRLVQNLTSLEHLYLSYVVVDSPIPSVLASFSRLKSLYLGSCGLLGEFPTPIFHLPNIQTLWLINNPGLAGYIPEFSFSGNSNSSSKLKVIALLNTGFWGELPASIGYLDSLEFLGIGDCNFTGLLPSTLGNLPKLGFLDLRYNSFTGLLPSTLGNLTKLTFLNLRTNSFTGPIPPQIMNLTQLTYLNLGENMLEGSIPPQISNLTQLTYLNLVGNMLQGSIPPQITNLTQLTDLNLMGNMLQGSIPSSVSRLEKLEFFDCDFNQLSGKVELDAFLQLKELKSLFLSLNNLTLVTRVNNTIASSDLPQLLNIGVRSCHLREFPTFLRSQRQLQLLDLSSNNIQGRIPTWMSEVSIDTLLFLDLSNNSLTGFDDGFPRILPWLKLHFLKLDSNILRGSLPVPPYSTTVYSVKNNSLTGEIPQFLCNQTNLSILDISHNNLSGEIPRCLSNFSRSLLVLQLGANNFHGQIPLNWARGNSLKMIDFGENKLRGKIPKSLMECTMLEYLDLGNNQISDVFPSWLGVLKELQVLLLRSNSLYGTIRNPNRSGFVFPKLRIIDLSGNRFNGALPSDYFKKWNAMRSLDEKIAKSTSADYMFEYVDMNINVMHVPRSYDFSMTIINKGVRREYAKIIQTLVVVDLSCNQFDGEIPDSIRNLKELQMLNLSNNNLAGRIPLAITKLTNLEALDLSQNKLTGRIPVQLAQLNFLGVFNVSYNNLTGPIPQGQQFETFQNDSYDGNVGLCGKPLVKECEDFGDSPSSSSEDLGFFDELHWMVVMLGYGCGSLIGIVVGHLATKRKQNWFGIGKMFSKTTTVRRRPFRG